MKKVYKILAITAALMWGFGLQSCNNEVEEVSPRYPILFDCEGDTRAVADLDTMKRDENGFGVFAHYEFPENYGGKEFNFKKQVTYDSSKSAWTYNGLEYWLAGATYNFVAVYPYSIAEGTSSTDGATYSFENYNVADQLDIMVAKASAEVPEDKEFGPIPYTGSAVNLSFDHILSNIIVKVKAEVADVTVKSISLSSIWDQGNCDNGTWTKDSENKFTFTVDKPITNELKDITNGGLLLIPQLAKGITLTVNATIAGVNKTYEATIPDITWLSGTRYTYTINIKQSDITFGELDVEIWDVENATGSVIIK